VSEVIWGEYEGRLQVTGDRLQHSEDRLQVTGDRLQEDVALTVTSNLSPVTSSGPWLFPAALRSRHPRRFVFDAAGALRLLTPAEPFLGEELPQRKFLVFAPYGRHEDPYGLPALRSVWWLAYFKRQVLRFWVMFAEKFGTPTTVLRHPLGATEREKAAYRCIIGSIQQETGLIVPEGVELELLEAQRSGTVQTYSDLLHFCNEEMSKALVGQTLTSEATQRGARSLGEVHLAVRQDIVRQDAQALEALVNGQLVRWIVDLNFPPALRLYPRWRLSPPRQDDLALQLSIDAFFLGQGLALDETELYARYGRAQVTGNRLQD
jgi:phage gp29-like protein